MSRQLAATFRDGQCQTRCGGAAGRTAGVHVTGSLSPRSPMERGVRPGSRSPGRTPYRARS